MKLYLISKYRTQLMGIATIAILLLHFLNLNGMYVYKLPWLFGSLFGSSGVDIFIICSMVGLYYSLSNNGDLIEFYKRRLFRVVVPYLIIVIPIWLLSNPITALTHISTLYFWKYGNDGTWYIPFILTVYLAFPLLYKLVNKSNKIIYMILFFAVIVICFLNLFCPITAQKYGLALGRIPSVLIGILIGKSAFWGG